MTAAETSTKGSRLTWIVVGIGAAIVVLGVVLASRFGSDPSLTASPLIGRPAADVVMVSFDGGEDVRLSDYEGDIVVMNFWASWCLNCRVEHAGLVAAAEDYQDLGVKFIAVNYQDGRRQAEGFLDQLGRSEATTYTVDERSRTAFEFGVLGLPETFFIDRDGIIVGKVSGPVDFRLLTRTIDAIVLGQAVGEVKTGEVENR